MLSVNGRYMDGQHVVGYNFINLETGEQRRESKERVIYLICKNQINNMRVQTGTDGEIIIRGKGINLNNLPVVNLNDANKQFKSSVKRFKITKRIMYKNQIAGYQLVDANGKITNQKKNVVEDLAARKLILDTSVSRVNDKNGKTRVTLTGDHYDMTQLPILILSDDGQIVDPTREVGSLTIRAAYMKHSGILFNNKTGINKPFKNRDYIVCETDGIVNIISNQQFTEMFMPDNKKEADCDLYMHDIEDNYIDVFGGDRIKLTPSMILGWRVFKCVSQTRRM